ncbi:MAG: head-tail adaptor protein [Clostridia bacterium]|nr:head-tail adaptor protein [Clostridia bacterium]
MGRNQYRHTVRILRRTEDTAVTGGYDADPYVEVAVTSAGVRDESETEYAAAESAQIAHVKTFAMRSRDIRDDDLIVWHGDAYRVRRVDRYEHAGREIRVRGVLSRSRYTVVAQDG